MIEKEVIEEVKQSVDLVALIRSRGVELKRSGRSYKGLCPFHSEKEPSFTVNPKERLWQCFGCGAAGDAIRFIELFDKVGFKEAVEKLGGSASRDQSGNGGSAKRKEPCPPAPPIDQAASTVRRIKLIGRVIDFYHTAFSEDGRARDYLAKRGITENSLFSSYKIGFANGTLLNVLPNEGDITSELKELGILNEKGGEHFHGCVTFPLYDLAGSPVGIYGRRCEGATCGNGPTHLYLPGPRRGLFNRQAARSSKEIILTEAVLDSFTLIHSGIHNTIPCYGVNGLTAEHLELLRQYRVETVYLAFDADEPGRTGAGNLTGRLTAEGLRAHQVSLPEGEDINSYFSLTADSKECFLNVLRQAGSQAKEAVKEKSEEVAARDLSAGAILRPENNYSATGFGFTVSLNGRKFEVRGISRADTKLKATVKGISEGKAGRRFHVDTVDFYSARSRAYLVKGLSDLFGDAQEVIQADVESLMDYAEKWREVEPAPPESAEVTGEARDRALTFLKNPEMFNEILSDFETLGYTGEEMNKLLCYLAAVSRKLDEPLSVMIQSRSAAGKSFLQDTVLSLIPEEEFIKYTRLTDQALFYKDGGSLSHKILAVEEFDGMGGAVYSIRSIQSSKKITIAYTGKDAVTGKLKTEENTVEGPLCVFITTTRPDIDGETASRFVFLSIDESREMTEKILAKQRESYTREGILRCLKSDAVKEKHRNAGRLLRPLGVINPYAPYLTFTSRSLRARRDHVKYQNLILAVAYLFQYQRKTVVIEFGGKSLECVVATLDDVARAGEIANVVLGRSLDELSPPSRKLLMLIREMSEKALAGSKQSLREYRFSRREIREFSGWSDFQVRTHIQQLEDLEYLYAAAGRRGKEYVYELIYTGGGEDGKPFLIGLIDMGELKKKAEEAGIFD
jgi:DNA primase catalytic core